MRVWIGVAEASGDALASQLVTVLRRQLPTVELRGMVGPQCRALGVSTVARSEEATSLGLVESALRAPRLLRLLGRLQADIRSWQPDVVVTVDSPSLLLRLQRRVHARRLHWVAPQIWAWRPGRADRIAASVDTLCCLLPFEPVWFRDQPVRAVFTGHPAAHARLTKVPQTPVLALLPGSRPDEVRRLWPALRDVAAAVARRVQGLRIVVGRAPTVQKSHLGGLSCTVVDGLDAAVGQASVAIVCSGTATLQVAARGVPQVVVYRVNPVTWTVGRALVRGVEHVALPNILAGRPVVPEHLQIIDPDRVADDVVALLEDPSQQREALEPILGELRPQGAVERVADEVLRLRARRSSPPGRSPTA